MNLKDDEINNLKEKNIILTKKIKNFENRKFIIINNSIDNNNSESYFVSSNRVPSDLSKNINDKLNIKDMKKKYKFNPSFHSSITNNNRKETIVIMKMLVYSSIKLKIIYIIQIIIQEIIFSRTLILVIVLN